MWMRESKKMGMGRCSSKNIFNCSPWFIIVTISTIGSNFTSAIKECIDYGTDSFSNNKRTNDIRNDDVNTVYNRAT